MGQDIQQRTKQNLWNAAFKKFLFFHQMIAFQKL